MHLTTKWNLHPTAYKWLLLALVLFVLFLLYTAVYATGMLTFSTLQVERWLLLRPQTRLDCLFYEWRNLGEAPVSILFTLILGGTCLLLGYRRRVFPYLLLLLLLGVGGELLGKGMFEQPLSDNLRSGMTTLTCPQIEKQPKSARLAVGLGAWWLVPSPSQASQSLAHKVAQMPVTVDPGDSENGYPGGHATRWAFVGLLVAWLAGKHIRSRVLRVLLVALGLVLAIGGGLMQFYIGAHFITDTIAGYLLGAATACWAIGLLVLNDSGRRQRRSVVVTEPLKDYLWDDETITSRYSQRL